MEGKMPSATADQIRETESKTREIKIYPWMAVYMSRSWQEMKKSILLELHQKKATVSGLPTVSGPSTVSGTAEQHRSGQ